MNLYNCIARYRAPSKTWCTLLLLTFSYYCYRNIYLQSEIGFKLPPVNLISALNSFETFADLPSNERFDLYVNLAKTFEAYKEDYLNHYEDYLLMLNSYLILDESQIALKYYAYKYYINQEYELNDGFVLGSPIVEFNLNFASVSNNRDRELNLINKHYHLFGVKDNKESCELFFNSYIYPLFKSQSDWKEVEIAKSMSQILNHWTLVKRLQISCFALSLSFILFSSTAFIISNYNPGCLYDTVFGYGFLIVFSMVFFSTLILACVCVSITIITYNINLNFEGLHNTSFNVLQIAWLLFIGYLSVLWISNFITENNPRNKVNNDDESDTLRNHINALMHLSPESVGKTNILLKDDIESIKNKDFSEKVSDEVVTTNIKENEHLEKEKVPILKSASIALNSGIKPIVTSLKQLMTPRPVNTAMTFDKIDKEFRDYAILDTSFEPFNEEKTPSDYSYHAGSENSPSNTSQATNIFTKDAINGFKALNLVSALSFNHPDVSPCNDSLLSYNTSQQGNSIDKMKTNSGSTSIKRDLNNKRAGFYQHAGLSIDNSNNTNNSGKSEVSSPYSSNPSVHESVYKFHYGSNIRPIQTKSYNHVGLLKYPIEKSNSMSNSKDANVEWERKFGLSSGISEAETIQSNSIKKTDSGASSSLGSRKKPLKNTVDTKEKEKSINSELIDDNHTNNNKHPKARSPKSRKPKERKKSNYEYFLPSTMQSECTESSAEVHSDDHEIETGPIDSRSIQEQPSGTTFSLKSISNEHRRSL